MLPSGSQVQMQVYLAPKSMILPLLLASERKGTLLFGKVCGKRKEINLEIQVTNSRKGVFSFKIVMRLSIIS